MEEYLTLDICSRCIFFSEIVMVMINWPRLTNRFAVVRFINHSYYFRPNWTPLDPITTMNCYNFLRNVCDAFPFLGE